MLSRAAVTDGMRKRFGKVFEDDGEFAAQTIVFTKDAAKGKDPRVVSGVITSVAPDNQGEVVVTSGLDTGYLEKFRTVYLSHDYDKPVGTMRAIKRGKDSIWASTYLTTTTLGDDVLTMVQENVLRGISIGFVSKAFGAPTDEEQERFGECDVIHRQGSVFEYSITGMPCNSDAELDPVMKSIDRLLTRGVIKRASAAACGFPVSPDRKFFRAAPIMAHDGTVMVPIRSRA